MPDTTNGVAGSPSLEYPDYWWYRVRSQLLRVVFAGYVHERDRVLDVGSADGPSVQWMPGGRRVALDLDPRGLRPGDVCGSAGHLPFADHSFDVVVAFDVLEHCRDETAAVSELTRVLRPAGRLLLSTPAYQWAWTSFDEDVGHYRRYTRDRLTAATARAGLRIDRSTYAFTATFPLFVAERLVRRIRQRRGLDATGLPQVPGWIDKLLVRLASFDAVLLQHRDLPYGSSVLVAATRPERPSAPEREQAVAHEAQHDRDTEDDHLSGQHRSADLLHRGR